MRKLRGQKERRVTLREVARLAGVSVTTASVVLAGKGVQERISPEVIERVLECARQNDYAPNLLVRSMQKGKTQTLGFFNAFPNYFPQDHYYNRIKEGLETGARQRGYNLLLFCAPKPDVEGLYQQLNGGFCDGLVYFGPYRSDPLVGLLRQSRLPTILLNHADPEGVLSSIRDDWEDGIRQIAARLHALGHRRIAAITSLPGESYDAAARVALFQRALGELGIALPDELIVPFRHYSTAGGVEAVSVLLSRPHPPTAIFCWHDLAGYGVLDALAEMGISVPGQVSVVGYDGIRWSRAYGEGLASVHVDVVEQARVAVNLLDRMIRGNEVGPWEEVYPVMLRPGTTLGPPISV